MEICRACLKNDFPDNMIPIDESFLNGYNLLTNLNVTLLDGMSQYSCEDCVNTLASFITFREKCISSEYALQQYLIEKIKVEQDPDPDSKTKPRRSTRIKRATDKNILNASIGNIIKEKPTENIQDAEILIKTEIKEETLDFFLEDVNDNYDIGAINQEEIKDEKPKKTSRKVENKSSKGVKELPCGLCKLVFSSPETAEFTKHFESHQSELSCQICKESFECWPELVGHRIEHLKNENKHCHICNKWFMTAASLEFHFRKIHLQMEDTSLRCKQCFKRYETPRKLRKHSWSMHKHSLNNFICDICSKTVKFKQALVCHMRKHFDVKAFTCDLCGLSFKQNVGLKDHIHRKHSPDKTNCKVCLRVFPNKEKMDKHKCCAAQLVCPVCGVSVSGRRLKRHLRTHDPVGRFKCSRCPAVYKSKDALNVHENRHDGKRTYKCEYCELAFYGRPTLLKHRRVHTGEKPYKCSICQKGFTANHNLKVHMKVHGFYNLIVKKNQEGHAPTATVTELGATGTDRVL